MFLAYKAPGEHDNSDSESNEDEEEYIKIENVIEAKLKNKKEEEKKQNEMIGMIGQMKQNDIFNNENSIKSFTSNQEPIFVGNSSAQISKIDFVEQSSSSIIQSQIFAEPKKDPNLSNSSIIKDKKDVNDFLLGDKNDFLKLLEVNFFFFNFLEKTRNPCHFRND